EDLRETAGTRGSPKQRVEGVAERFPGQRRPRRKRLPDRPHGGARPGNFPQVAKDPGQLLVLDAPEKRLGAPRERRVEAHVERPRRLEGESARGIVELEGGKPEIRQDTVHGTYAEVLERGPHPGKTSAPRHEPGLRYGHCGARACDSSRVTIQTYQPPLHPQRAEDRGGMTAASPRRVHIGPSRISQEQLDGLLLENRDVTRRFHF